MHMTARTMPTMKIMLNADAEGRAPTTMVFPFTILVRGTVNEAIIVVVSTGAIAFPSFLRD
jgi:hypothetical protein